MKRFPRFAWLVLVPIHYSAAAGSILRIADGDCAGLTAAATFPPGKEPGLIVLARDGNYGACSNAMEITGNIAIDGAGATFPLTSSGIVVDPGAKLELRNLSFSDTNLSTTSATQRATLSSQPKFLGGTFVYGIYNGGTLILDRVTMADVGFHNGIGSMAASIFGPILNNGKLNIRNSTLQPSFVSNEFPIFGAQGQVGATGQVEIFNSTLLLTGSHGHSEAPLFSGHVTLANNIIMFQVPGAQLCYSGQSGVVSLGGNVLSDNSCGFNSTSDRIVADPGLSDLGKHGGVVDTLALSYFSPAKGAGLAANCEATDARGVARGIDHCDAGAYEFGGGEGRLGASGASGLYYDAAHDGHYVTVQRLDSGEALVIWNTFDANGTPAWLYGVGPVSGNTIHVGQVSQNVGGKLQPSGAVIGSKETTWGSFDFAASSCAAAMLTYNSLHPAFGTGSVNLTRLALVNGVECSQ